MSFTPIELWLPSDIEAYIQRVSDGYDTLEGDIKKSGRYDESKSKAFAIAAASFRSWRSGVTYLSELTLSPLRIAEQFASVLEYWRKDFADSTGIAATGATVVLPTAEHEKSIISKALTVVAWGVGVYALGQVLTTARFFGGRK